MYATWKLVSGRGACLLELGRQLIKAEGVTEVSYNSRVYTLLAEIHSDILSHGSKPTFNSKNVLHCLCQLVLTVLGCGGLPSRSDLHTSFLIIAWYHVTSHLTKWPKRTFKAFRQVIMNDVSYCTVSQSVRCRPHRPHTEHHSYQYPCQTRWWHRPKKLFKRTSDHGL